MPFVCLTSGWVSVHFASCLNEFRWFRLQLYPVVYIQYSSAYAESLSNFCHKSHCKYIFTKTPSKHFHPNEIYFRGAHHVTVKHLIRATIWCNHNKVFSCLMSVSSKILLMITGQSWEYSGQTMRRSLQTCLRCAGPVGHNQQTNTKAPCELWNPLSKSVPDKLHWYGGQ